MAEHALGLRHLRWRESCEYETAEQETELEPREGTAYLSYAVSFGITKTTKPPKPVKLKQVWCGGKMP